MAIYNLYLSIVLSLIIIFCTRQQQLQQVSAQATCHMRELDLCAASLLVLTQSNGLPTNDVEINKQCVQLKEAENCFQNFTTRCATPVQLELLSLGTNSTLELLAEYCTKGSSVRTQYLKHAKCLSSIERKEQRVCMRDLQASIELLTTPSGGGGGNNTINISNGKGVQVGCCAHRRFDNCLGVQIEKKCGKEALNMVNSMQQRITSRFPELLCRQYKQEECRKILPKPGTVPKGAKSNSIISRLLSAYSGL